jgi:hypothetical protein
VSAKRYFYANNAMLQYCAMPRPGEIPRCDVMGNHYSSTTLASNFRSAN